MVQGFKVTDDAERQGVRWRKAMDEMRLEK
jgi:hypothetical protein